MMVLYCLYFFACICVGIVPYTTYVEKFKYVMYVHIYVRWETPSNEMCVVSIEIRVVVKNKKLPDGLSFDKGKRNN